MVYVELRVLDASVGLAVFVGTFVTGVVSIRRAHIVRQATLVPVPGQILTRFAASTTGTSYV